MAKTKTSKRPLSAGKVSGRVVAVQQEADAVYFLKLVMYLIIGSQWVRITKGDSTFPIPIGLMIGLLFARTDKLSIDRKIEYAILLVATFVGFWLPLGVELVI